MDNLLFNDMQKYMLEARRITSRVLQQAQADLIITGSWKSAIEYLSSEELVKLGNIRAKLLGCLIANTADSEMEG